MNEGELKNHMAALKERNDLRDKVEQLELQVGELRKAFEETCFRDGGGTHRVCRVCGADAGMSHYPQSPCEILNAIEKRKCVCGGVGLGVACEAGCPNA